MTAITIKKAEELRDKLKAAPKVSPEKVEITKTELIGMLRGEIEAMQKRGYSLADIAKFITDDGIEITAPTLKSYLQRSKTNKKPRAKKTTVTPKGEATNTVDTNKSEPKEFGYNPVPNKEELL